MRENELASKRRLLVGVLTQLAFTESKVSQVTAKIMAIGMPLPLAAKMGMLPNAQQLMIDEVTVENGRKLLNDIEVMEPMIARSIEAQGGEIINEGKEYGLQSMRAMGIIADRIIALMTSDEQHVEQMLNAMGVPSQEGNDG